uniref:Cubilin-like n=1 Tax=Crassostrea virginica TaxID=6565 RepID=A0A8B8CWM9_CRAVI|nr:cubilin-like [Crassostrea virginica]
MQPQRFLMGLGLLLPLCALIQVCIAHGPCFQLNIIDSSATITKLENPTSCEWKLTPINTTISIALDKRACNHSIFVSRDENFTDIFWSSQNCSESNVTKILTGKIVFLRANSSTPDNSIVVSNYDCSTDYGQTHGRINTDFKEGQFHVTPVICRYTISLPKYYTIDLQIHRVQLQNPDILSVRDRHSEISRVVGPETRDNFLRLVNSSFLEVAFESCSMCSRKTPTIVNISWSHCGGVFSDTRNFSTVIRGGRNVTINCLFLLNSSSSQSMAFHLKHFSQITTACENDFMQVYDHEYDASRLVRQYCKKARDDLVVSSTNQMVLRLVSNGSTQSINVSGIVEQKQECGQEDYYYQGEIVSPDSPLSVNCQYTVTTHRQGRIWLLFTSVTLPARSNGHCSDFLQVTDITSGSTQQYCGDIIPRSQLFSGNEAAIKFFTNGNRDDLNASFKIHFTECGGILSGFSGIIAGMQLYSSPEFNHAENCVWEIDNHEAEEVHLKFQNNVTSLCKTSFKLTDANGNRTELLCSQTSPVLQLQGRVQIEMSLSDVLFSFQSISWLVCGLVEQSKRGYHIIDLSLYNYVNRSCPIHLDATDIESYIISIKNLDHINCSREIKINNRPYSVNDTNLIGLHFRSPVSVHFASNSSCETDQSHHMQIQWKACNQTFRGPKGTFSSPGYPDHYSVNISCDYTIIARAGQQIYLTFLDFDVGQSRSENTCGEDRVEIFSGNHADVHCGKRKNDESIQFLSSGPRTTVRFISIGSESGKFKGFLVSYYVFNTDAQAVADALDRSTDEYHELKQGLLSYRTTLATTVAMGICIGVLIFIVIALSGFLVRLRKRKGYHNPVLPQPSNASAANLNGITSQGSRKHGYIKKKDSNSLATPNLKTSRQSSGVNTTDDEKKDIGSAENDVYNHLHEEATKKPKDASKRDDYSTVGVNSQEYSQCARVGKSSVILGDSDYGHTETRAGRSGLEDGQKIYSLVKKRETSQDPTEQESNEKMCKNTKSVVNDDVKPVKDDDIRTSKLGKTDSDLNVGRPRTKSKKKGNRVKKDVYLNVDRNSNEYGNWREISDHFQETHTRNDGENKEYTNTESIYSNNINEDDVYSNSVYM